jgi:hypothetical protein
LGVVLQQQIKLTKSTRWIKEQPMAIKKILSESRSIKEKKRSTRDSSLLHLLFIRDAIGMFPRPKKNRGKSASKGAVESKKSTQARLALIKNQNIEQDESAKVMDLLVERLEAYDALLEKIDNIAHNALTIIDGTQVGGRKPRLEVKTMVLKSAIDHHTKCGKYPSAAKLCEIVRRDLFKNSPKKFIEIVAKKMDAKEVERHSVNPTWDYWKHIDGVVSEKTVSTILLELRTASTSI